MKFITFTHFLLLISCSGELEKNTETDYKAAMKKMLERDIAGRGIKDLTVLKAMEMVPRHEFVPDKLRDEAYRDTPLPIGQGQTISQPYIVAAMTEALNLSKDDKVLEIGTGSGYQAAILGKIVHEVYTIEIIPSLAEKATQTLSALNFSNVVVKTGDGYLGWPEHAPFDGIMVTAAPDHIPQPLIDQLKPGGRMILPVGKKFRTQQLLLVTKDKDGRVRERNLMLVRFVPLTGKHSKPKMD